MNPALNLIEYPDRPSMMAQVAQRIAADLRSALEDKPRVSLAVPGGTTPGPLFDALCTADMDWSRVEIVLTDERWVPGDDPASNAKLVRARLMQDRAAAARFTPYYMADTDIADAARQQSAELAHLLPIDVLLLGMGADMHTASLFPDAPDLAAALAPDAPLLLPVTPAGQPVARFSLTAPALQTAVHIHLLITGADKYNALLRAQTLAPRDAPVALILPTATIHWSAT